VNKRDVGLAVGSQQGDTISFLDTESSQLACKPCCLVIEFGKASLLLVVLYCEVQLPDLGTTRHARGVTHDWCIDANEHPQ